jgi:hypothetical protein
MFRLFSRSKSFQSGNYWESRYKEGGNSGAGSYHHLAEFKAEVINNLVVEHRLSSLIEFGCGDGNQLSMLKCKKYIGLDVAVTALQICKKKFEKDTSKNFFLYHYLGFIDRQKVFESDAAMSLDVLYHLVEEKVYHGYLDHLFQSAAKMVIIYAADMDLPQKTPHELYRKFTRDIEKRYPGWKLAQHIKNKYPAKNYEDQEGSLADFYIYIPG